MLKFTLEEKLTGVRKPVGSTCERVNSQHSREPCPCGKGYIEYRWHNGTWVANHSVWLESSSFGRQEYAPCCEDCWRKQKEELDTELADEGILHWR